MRVLLAAAGVLVGLLPAPVTMADSPPPPPGPEPKSFCTQVYQPVCGTKDGTRRTYSNKYFADVDRAADIADGPCAPADGGPTKPQ